MQVSYLADAAELCTLLLLSLLLQQLLLRGLSAVAVAAAARSPRHCYTAASGECTAHLRATRFVRDTLSCYVAVALLLMTAFVHRCCFCCF